MIAIIAVVISQVNFQHLVHFLEQVQGLVQRGMAHCRELGLDFCIELSRVGMPFAGSNQPYQLDTLGCKPENVGYLYNLNRYPTPGSVWMYVGREGSGSSLRRRLLMLTRRICKSL